MPAVQMTFDFPVDAEQSSSSVPIDKSFPEEAADRLARVEAFNKHLYRPNTYLHKWWARRSGVCFRYILKQLVKDGRKRGYYEPGGLEGTTVLDPMMGGGTIVHEAVRLGANVIGADIDPIPVLQARATLQRPDIARKASIFARFLAELRRVLGPYFGTACRLCGRVAELQFMLYGQRRRCGCGLVTVVDSLILREERDSCGLRLCAACSRLHHPEGQRCEGEGSRLIEKGARFCDRCREPLRELLAERFVDRYRPLVVVGHCALHGQFYGSPLPEDLAAIERARASACRIKFAEGLMKVAHGPKSDDLLRRGIQFFHELFTPRQQLYVEHARRTLQSLEERDRLWLSLLVSTSLEFNSLLCGYKGVDERRAGAIRHVFSHHAYSFPYTALENNPIFSGRTSGTLERLFHDRIVKAGRWALTPAERSLSRGRVTKVLVHGERDFGAEVRSVAELRRGRRRFIVRQADARSLRLPPDCVDYVVTDPPYYDNVQYSDLSTFFRVWLAAFLPDQADWSYERLCSAVVDGCQSDGESYADALARIWKRCFTFLRKDWGRLIFTFHHWRWDAWAQLTVSLKRAGFLLVNRYVVSSENPRSVHIRGLRALKHDCILVLRPNAGPADATSWANPGDVDMSSSYEFCQQCGAALGWLLSSKFNEGEIRREWRRLFREEQQ